MTDQNAQACCDPTRELPMCAECCATCGDFKSVDGTDMCRVCLDAHYDRLDRMDERPCGRRRDYMETD